MCWNVRHATPLILDAGLQGHDASAVAATGDAGSLVTATTRERPTCRSRAARVSTLRPLAEIGHDQGVAAGGRADGCRTELGDRVQAGCPQPERDHLRRVVRAAHAEQHHASWVSRDVGEGMGVRQGHGQSLERRRLRLQVRPEGRGLLVRAAADSWP